MTSSLWTANRAFGEPQAMPIRINRIVSPIILIESKSQNGSEMVKNFGHSMQGDLRVGKAP